MPTAHTPTAGDQMTSITVELSNLELACLLEYGRTNGLGTPPLAAAVLIRRHVQPLVDRVRAHAAATPADRAALSSTISDLLSRLPASARTSDLDLVLAACGHPDEKVRVSRGYAALDRVLRRHGISIGSNPDGRPQTLLDYAITRFPNWPTTLLLCPQDGADHGGHHMADLTNWSTTFLADQAAEHGHPALGDLVNASPEDAVTVARLVDFVEHHLASTLYVDWMTSFAERMTNAYGDRRSDGSVVRAAWVTEAQVDLGFGGASVVMGADVAEAVLDAVRRRAVLEGVAVATGAWWATSPRAIAPIASNPGIEGKG